MTLPRPILLAGLLITCAATSVARADVRLAALFSDHAVLQQGVPVPVWGWADAGEAVTVRIAGQEKSIAAGADGKWMVRLDPLTSGEPLTMSVSGRNAISVRDVLVGEVWLASGQSNMQFEVRTARDGLQEAAGANDPMLRMFTVPRGGALEPQAEAKGAWQTATAGQPAGWSAVAYFYAKELRAALKVPVGVVHSSYGGTAAESWTSLDALGTDPGWKAAAEREIAATRRLPEDVKAFPTLLAKWLADHAAADSGNVGFGKGWAGPDFDDAAWQSVPLTVTPAKLGMTGGGVLWLRRSFALNAPPAGQEGRINVNFFSGADATVYLNGVAVPELTGAPKGYTTQRVFTLPRAQIKVGQPNLIAIRVHAFAPNGGFVQTTRRMEMPFVDPKSLDDQWKVAVEATFPPVSDADAKALPRSPNADLVHMSSALFNQMIHPLIPYAIKGAIWYQGENNANPTAARSFDYRRLLAAMVRDWRGRWGEGDFPFYVVQLANYGQNQPQPGESNWAMLRESQAYVARHTTNAGLAVAIDLGQADNIHPTNKQDVGHRLAVVALKQTYGRDVVDEGPSYATMAVEGNAIRVKFDHVAGGLVAKGGPLKTFAIAGEDHRFVWADARIDGDGVIVSSASVAKPTAVRYAWADNPEGCNLYNDAGLPAVPFRTDATDAPSAK